MAQWLLSVNFVNVSKYWLIGWSFRVKIVQGYAGEQNC